MSQTPHQVLHQELLQLRGWAKAWLEGRDSGRFFPCGGICSNLKLDDANFDLLRDLMKAWPAGTGKGDYPVPHPDKNFSQAYRDASNRELWNPEFEYARNRWALLDWLIEQTAPDARISINAPTWCATQGEKS